VKPALIFEHGGGTKTSGTDAGKKNDLKGYGKKKKKKETNL